MLLLEGVDNDKTDVLPAWIDNLPLVWTMFGAGLMGRTHVVLWKDPSGEVLVVRLQLGQNYNARMARLYSCKNGTTRRIC